MRRVRYAAALVVLFVGLIPAAASARDHGERAGRTPGRITFVVSSGVRSLAVVPAAGGRLRQLVRGGRIADPDWSPDGRRIVFSRARAGIAQLYVLRVADRRLRQLTHSRQPSIEPDWSPNGRQIVFVRVVGGSTKVLMYNLRTRSARVLLPGRHSDSTPAYSPNGRRIAFTRLLTSSGAEAEEPVFKNEIYVAQANGSHPVRLTRSPGTGVDPAWSPNGRWIAYSAATGASSRIVIMRPNGTGKRVVTEGPLDLEPAWSPDGRNIAFTRRTRGRASIEIVSVSAGRPHELAVGRRVATSPDWH